MSYWDDKGCLAYGLFFLWMGIVVGVPSLIFESREVGICSIIGVSIGFAALAGIDQSKKESFKKELPLTYAHLWVLVGYAVSGILKIGFSKLSYDEMIGIGKCTVFYMIFPIIALILDCTIGGKRHNKGQE